MVSIYDTNTQIPYLYIHQDCAVYWSDSVDVNCNCSNCVLVQVCCGWIFWFRNFISTTQWHKFYQFAIVVVVCLFGWLVRGKRHSKSIYPWFHAYHMIYRRESSDRLDRRWQTIFQIKQNFFFRSLFFQRVFFLCLYVYWKYYVCGVCTWQTIELDTHIKKEQQRQSKLK